MTSGWTGFDPVDLPRARYAAFLASIGILVAALGGNLEEEDADQEVLSRVLPKPLYIET